jgi:geranylgeranyl pyrophosphate synthase
MEILRGLSMTSFETRLSNWREIFSDALASHIQECYLGEDLVTQATRYALLAGGKRVRPLLCLLTNEALGGKLPQAMTAALAVEFIHTYSLVHDDLPSMDNDDLRRGKPTAHKVYGEAQALLAGDALLTDAFGLVAGSGADASIDSQAKVAMVRELAAASGSQGMVLGQSLDLYWTARTGAERQHLDQIHERKTGRLLGCSAALGAIAAGTSPDVVQRFRSFGERLGLAFQIMDDLLDESTATGKSVGKDKDAGKLTYLAMMSPTAARAAAENQSKLALAELSGIVPKNSDLELFAHWLLKRTF